MSKLLHLGHIGAIGVDIASQIDWNRSYSVELNEYDCVLLPAETCNPEFRIFNEGNYQDIVKISVSDTPSLSPFRN